MSGKRTVMAEELEVLKDHPEARENDNLLLGLVWLLEDPSLPADLPNRLESLSKAGTILRYRKTIQHKQLRFRPSSGVLKPREPRTGPRR